MSDLVSCLQALGDVSGTGLLTAFAHAAESRSAARLLEDPRAGEVADRLAPLLADSPSRFLRRLARNGARADLVLHLALRARHYDRCAQAFVAAHPSAAVVNLGCGLDMRFWRIDDGRLRLYDLDLPEMIALKLNFVEETDRYHVVACSALDLAWMDRVASDGAGPHVFLAEGLFMYLPPDGVRALVLGLLERFPGSELVFETVNSRWLAPSLRWLIDVKLQREFGLGKEATFRFGIRDGHEPESWSPGIRFLGEWTYVDEDEPRLGVHRVMRASRLLRYTQWTVRYALGA